MKIGTVNIDWLKKSKVTKDLIINEINKQDFDFLIVTENILSFQFNEKYYAYHSAPIPTNAIFQYLDYGEYLKGEIPIRTSIYSKHKSIGKLETLDAYTSLCHKFNIDEREIVIYGTIIGTYGIKYQEEIARPELEYFKADIQNITSNNENIFVAGDFNTSFIVEEGRQLSAIKSRSEMVNFTNALEIHRTTELIKDNIDHIFISSNLKQNSDIKCSTFLKDNMLKDIPHKGIILECTFHS